MSGADMDTNYKPQEGRRRWDDQPLSCDHREDQSDNEGDAKGQQVDA